MNKIHKITLLVSEDWLGKVGSYVRILDMTQHWMPDDLPDQAVIRAILRAGITDEELAYVPQDKVLMDTIGYKGEGECDTQEQD